MTRFSRILATLALVAGVATTTADAQADDTLTRLRETLKREPKAPDVVKMALDYYRVSPEHMESVRSAARTRALLPVVSGFGGYNSTGNAQASAQTISNPQNVVVNGASSVTVLTGGVAFDLRELVFNPAEIQTYGAIPIQKDITVEVVRTYYLRRQLQIRLALKPPTDPLALATLELRVEEYTGLLSAMTGGAFLRVANAVGPT
jgi:hypothetical protein